MPILFFPILSTPSTPAGVLATIPPAATSAHYRRFALWPTPSAVITYLVDYERDITDMVANDDDPLLPTRFHRLLAIGARMKEYEKREDSNRFLLAKREYDAGISDLKYWIGRETGGVMGRRVIRRPSQLGGWYPAGS